MSRTIRKGSNTGVYHIMLRGINKQCIFNDDEDKRRRHCYELNRRIPNGMYDGVRGAKPVSGQPLLDFLLNLYLLYISDCINEIIMIIFQSKDHTIVGRSDRDVQLTLSRRM